MTIAKLIQLQMMDGTLIKSLTMGRRNPVLPPVHRAANKLTVKVNGAVANVDSIAMVKDATTTGKVLIPPVLVVGL